MSPVPRIALLVSDVCVDAHPPLPAVSTFQRAFADLRKSSAHTPTLVPVPAGADPSIALLLHASNARLVSLVASATPKLAAHLVLHLAELSDTPVVLHLAVTDDLSDVLLLRPAVPYFLLSSSAQQAHDNALLASRLARVERKLVIHAFNAAVSDTPLEELPEDKVLPFIVGPSPNGVLNGINGKASSKDPSVLQQLFKSYEAAALSTLSLVRRPFRPLVSRGTPNPHTVLFILGLQDINFTLEGVSFVTVALLGPLPPSRILNAIPDSVSRVIVLEQIHRWSVKWTPLYLDVVSALQERDIEHRPIVQTGVLGDSASLTEVDVLKFLENASSTESPARLQLGAAPIAGKASSLPPHVPKHELSYTKILSHLFDDRLEVSNSPSLVPSQGEIATSPEFALGRVRGQVDQRAELVRAVQDLLQSKGLDSDLHSLLGKWTLAKDDPAKSRTLGDAIIKGLEEAQLGHPSADHILALRAHLPSVSRWIIGSDAWSYDLGASGLHHAIASGLNVNVLLLDTLPYSARNSADPNRRKHDVGLYAMNHGDVYVASVAVYSSYSQVLQSLIEADRFNGPSVVLAYLPYETESASALDVLKETKVAVDTGYWPLYRWDPSKERQGREPFSLDSDAVKNDLQQFLDRQNHLSQLVRSKPQMASELVSSLGETVREARKKKAQQSYNDLLTALDAPPLLVLYASDGGAAEKLAKRLANRGTARGLSTTIATLDSMSLESLAQDQYVAFVTSVAGQGEPPQNGRTFFKALNAAVARGDQTLGKLRYTVFGMGDSHYWPRPEDAHYYNKPGKDLDARLEKLGGERVAPLGLGDDQDADGPQTGYKVWEPLVWKVLGVDAIEVTEAEPEPITNEHIKAASQYLRGTILEGLEDTTTGAISPSDGQLTKFHGIYQQDDRDIRDERQAQGTEPAYSFMIRVRMPGGVCKPEQWLQMDQIADEHGCGTFKITTRQTFQFHGVIKRHLKPAIQDINRVLLDTLAACGDVNRNVTCSSIPTLSKLHEQVFQFSKSVSEHLIPRTTAYHEIWLDKKLVAGEALKDFEPLYGEFYLPRKFKIAVAVPPNNDVDVFANDLGFIAVVDENGELSGFNVTIGGGMGVTHGNKKTYPRIGDIIGFCTMEQGKYVAEQVMLVQRDHGNRADRKNARLKYTIDRMGLDVYKAEVEKRLGYALGPARPFTFDRNIDDYGWAVGEDGRHHFMLFIENGRVQDEPGRDFKTGLREIAKVHKGAFRLTTNQHICVSDIAPEDVPQIKRLLAEYKLDNLEHSGLRLASSACVAFPTCGLAMAESERYLPVLIDKVETICEENGLRNDAIVMRMTGCPNGCARPYVAEVAFVGKAPGTYSMLLGGGYYGQRMNKIYRETVTEREILAILGPMIKRYALERLEGERFGDFTIRAGYISPTTSGKEWYTGMGGEGEHREIMA
ncbi:sulfite reductase subunit beta [Mycena rosella]|uniref:assimilatory sulfite reductase (NADPH) n=1 Tax=Mycena rosella TaxID=1033263 RepID=A0AAD7GQ31_MYCRO|nr:sulfite reductase subunit beta [Mycena rosella]